MRALDELEQPLHPGSGYADAGGASVGSAWRATWVDLRAMVREHAYLAVLEAQRAGLHLAYVVGAVLIVSVLAVTAWLALVTGMVVLLTPRMSWPAVLSIAAVLNLLVAGAVAWWVKGKITEMPFSATLRQLSAGRRELDAARRHA